MLPSLISLAPSVVQTGSSFHEKERKAHRFANVWPFIFNHICFCFFCSYTNKFIFLKNDFVLRLFAGFWLWDLRESTYLVRYLLREDASARSVNVFRRSSILYLPIVSFWITIILSIGYIEFVLTIGECFSLWKILERDLESGNSRHTASG